MKQPLIEPDPKKPSHVNLPGTPLSAYEQSIYQYLVDIDMPTRDIGRLLGIREHRIERTTNIICEKKGLRGRLSLLCAVCRALQDELNEVNNRLLGEFGGRGVPLSLDESV